MSEHIEILDDRAVIRLDGDDGRSFLQGLITQDLDQLTSDHAIFSALLTPQGKILFDFMIVDAGAALFIDCRRETAPALLKRLTLYKLRAKVTLAIDENLFVAASPAQISTGLAYQDPRLKALGWRAILDRTEDVPEGSYHQRRRSFGVPEFGVDFASDEMFLLDVNYDALNAVSYKKGCFVGQEVTSRMKRKGEVRKRTLIAEFNERTPEKAASIMAGPSTIGEILSGSDNRALALIRLDRWRKSKSDGATLTCDGVELRLRLPDYLEQA